MTYEAWRISYQDSEQAARAAFAEAESLRRQLSKVSTSRDCLIKENERLDDQVRELKRKHFTRFANEECWIYAGDGSDNLDTLVCPVVISPTDLNEIITRRDQLEVQLSSIQRVIHRDHSATRFSEICEIAGQSPAQSLAEIEAQAVEAILRDLKCDLPETNTALHIFKRLQLRVDVIRERAKANRHSAGDRGGKGYEREVLGQNNEGDTVTV